VSQYCRESNCLPTYPEVAHPNPNAFTQLQTFTIKLLIELRGEGANKEVIILIPLRRFEQNWKIQTFTLKDYIRIKEKVVIIEIISEKTVEIRRYSKQLFL